MARVGEDGRRFGEVLEEEAGVGEVLEEARVGEVLEEEARVGEVLEEAPVGEVEGARRRSLGASPRRRRVIAAARLAGEADEAGLADLSTPTTGPRGPTGPSPG
jgi:hypothetical protein